MADEQPARKRSRKSTRKSTTANTNPSTNPSTNPDSSPGTDPSSNPGTEQRSATRPAKRRAKGTGQLAADATLQTHAPKGPLRSRPTGRATGAVVTMVCLTCGNEMFFDEAPIEALKCPTCGGTVFRRFDTPSKHDQAAESAAEEQARSMAYGDSSPETSPDEVRDLHG